MVDDTLIVVVDSVEVDVVVLLLVVVGLVVVVDVVVLVKYDETVEVTLRKRYDHNFRYNRMFRV